MNIDWQSDKRLDILILGPMGEDSKKEATLRPIKDAVEALLSEPDFAAILSRNGVTITDVHIPDDNQNQDITTDVLTHIDIADLVIFNFTPKSGRTEASANVFYELGLVHALGIPTIMMMSKGDKDTIPFYARGSLIHRVPNFNQDTLKDVLRPVVRDFLEPAHAKINFGDNRVTQFFGLPVVDISAAVGLATGYYVNFARRLIQEGGFIHAHADLIKEVVLVRPVAIDSTYAADMAALQKTLASQGHELKREKLDVPQNANDAQMGALWFEHVHGIVIDIPRTVYPLVRSPRLLTHLRRRPISAGAAVIKEFEQRQAQIGESLLDRFEGAIRYQMSVDGSLVRTRILHFSNMKEVAALVTKLLKKHQ